MRRLTLLAIAWSALLWAVAAVAPVASEQAVAIAGGEGTATAGEMPTPGDSDQRWRAAQFTLAAITESVWKSPAVHATLATMPSAHPFGRSLAVSSSDPPIRPALPYLRHRPILI